MARSPGQELALRQLSSMQLASPHGLEVLSVEDPTDETPSLWVEISLDCAGIKHESGGIGVRERERFLLAVDAGFPYEVPSVLVRHGRWAGSPHVQWRVSICLYAAPAIEWNPSGGMYDLIERLIDWLERAALGTLDPEGAPLHPPVAYTTTGTPLIIPRADTPSVSGDAWLGYATVDRPHEHRYDIDGWVPEHNDEGSLNTPPDNSAAAVLLDEPMDWEFPKTVSALLVALSKRGVRMPLLVAHLGYVAAFRGQDEPLLVIVGTPMRGIVGGAMKQHLTAWRIPAEEASKLTRALKRYSRDEVTREVGEEAIDAVIDWATSAKAEWCPVREARSEVTVRRDQDSPLSAFAGKTVAIWGCGALGAPIAEWVLRAGSNRLVLYDNANVNPGILVRQPYTDADVGLRKVNVLADRLRAIEPSASIETHVRNVLTGPLEREDWNDGADVVIDATAAVAVRSKLERVRRANPTNATLVTTIIGHTAGHGIAAIAFPQHTGAGEDILRATKLSCTKTPRLRGFLEEFWPNPPRSDLFQPEPGCSSPTFQGSCAEVQALASSLLTSVAVELCSVPVDESAVAHLLALPSAHHPGPPTARLAFTPALTMPDASDRFEIRLSEAARREILAWRAAAERRLSLMSETGGLLFGRRDDASGVIWIDEVSGPPPDSIETPEEFRCGTVGVAELASEKEERTGKSVEFLGMWHTHPGQSPAFSAQDLLGMMQLLAETDSPNGNGLILIVGWAATKPVLAAYNFEHDELRTDHARIEVHETRDLAKKVATPQDVGLALSGGGSRAIAFHLGCLRALNERGVLDRVRVVSGVSGGSVIAAMWAYQSSGDFSAFEEQVEELLRKGLHGEIARRHLLGRRSVQALGSSLLAGAAARATRVASGLRRQGASKLGGSVPSPMDPPLRRWVSRTVAFEDALKARLFGDQILTDPRRNDVDVILNACDLRTGSAFRFGSKESGSWRLGTVPGNEIEVATAVAASAAYPVFLPALDESWEFEHQKGRQYHRVILTDGGVFDNLGTTCLEPGRDPEISTNVTSVNFIVGCDAGRGLLAPRSPFGWSSQISRSFESTFRKVQDGSRSRLYAALETGELSGLVMPYLGQRDHTLPVSPPDLVRRELVSDLPTNFAPMASATIDLLSRRGEQLTRMLVDYHAPNL